ncbi:MAG: transposase [Treponema sp.]|nr:transposase [Treponema sp.]
MPKKFGPCHSVYARFNRWANKGVLEQAIVALQMGD